MAEAAAIAAGASVIKAGSAIILGNLTENKNHRRALVNNMDWIKREMEMLLVEAGVGDGLNEEKSYGGQVWHIWAQTVRELAYEVEDCLVSYKDRVTCRSDAPWYRRMLHLATTLPLRNRLGRRLAKFKERANEIIQQRIIHVPSSPGANSAPATSIAKITYTKPDKLEGIGKPKKDLLELLDLKALMVQPEIVQAAAVQPEMLQVVEQEILEVAEGQPNKLKVVSVVGFAGLGKTTLANAVFDSPDIIRMFPRRAWVEASTHGNTRDLLMDIIEQFKLLPIGPYSTQSPDILAKHINTCLQDGSRYFLVIDDLQTQPHKWNAIKSAFPKEGADGRIIVTTRIRSIARNCSSTRGCVHHMQALDRTHARTLFLREVFSGSSYCSDDFETGLASILDQCDGWPLALLDIAQLVKNSRENPLGADCQDACNKLGCHLDWLKTQDLETTRQVIIDSFNFNGENDGHRLKTCVLLASIYQKYRQTKWKRLLGRLLAEGESSTARGQFEELFNRGIIRPQGIRQNSDEFKTYQIGHVLLEFMICKQAYRNFITLIHNDEHISYGRKTDSAVRRLYLSGKTVNTRKMVTPESHKKHGLSSVRSLTIFDHDGDELVEFGKCKMLRVLDVENCNKVKDTDLQKICKLLYLKYLNLRGTNVKTLPRKASNLHNLQTLDMRETNVDIELPMEVLILRQLLHLFGRFKLPPKVSEVGEGHPLLKLLETESQLETFAGFILDGCNGFQHIMSSIRTLRKVKVWSGSTRIEKLESLAPSLQKRFIEGDALESLSIHFGDDSLDFLNSLEGPCALESIKLHGKLPRLPDFFFDGSHFQELQLSKTGLSCEDLSALQNLGSLLYLKLDEDSTIFVGGTFNFRPGGFGSLRRLCIQTPKLPEMDVKEGAMPALLSLELFSDDIQGLPVSAIKHIEKLSEVVIYTSVNAQTRKKWEDEAQKHKNRPAICVAQSKNTSQGQANN
ncbi:hypothetical protein ACQ4PT_068773 [Festuca glaucescens]